MDRFQIKGAPTCRVVYPVGLFEKRKPKDVEGEPKYNALIAVPKSDVDKMQQLAELYAKAFDELKAKGYKGKNAEALDARNNCYIDGDWWVDHKGGAEELRNYMILKTASRNFRPIVVDRQKRTILNGTQIPGLDVEQMSDEELCDGDYIIANVSFWTYCNAVAKGIGCNIHAVARIAPGEPLGGAARNVDEFLTLGEYE